MPHPHKSRASECKLRSSNCPSARIMPLHDSESNASTKQTAPSPRCTTHLFPGKPAFRYRSGGGQRVYSGPRPPRSMLETPKNMGRQGDHEVHRRYLGSSGCCTTSPSTSPPHPQQTSCTTHATGASRPLPWSALLGGGRRRVGACGLRDPCFLLVLFVFSFVNLCNDCVDCAHLNSPVFTFKVIALSVFQSCAAVVAFSPKVHAHVKSANPVDTR